MTDTLRESRPWGWYEVLFDGDYKVKRIHVLPDRRLSLQSHRFRQECWYVVHGQGRAVRGEEILPIREGDIVQIDRNQTHRLINDSTDTDLEIVEIQRGIYLGEDDIVRYEDDFGRVD